MHVYEHEPAEKLSSQDDTLRIVRTTMRYPGAFTFINRDTETPPNVKDYKHDPDISTHISRTRRRWTEEKRKARLERLSHSERKSPAVGVKVAIPRRSTPLEQPQRLPTDLIISVDESTSNGQAHKLCSRLQCAETRAVGLPQWRIRWTTPSLHLLKGNSDPFSASPVHITPEINELLDLSSRFYVFWAWSVSASNLFRAKAHEFWLQSVRGALSAQGAAEMRVMLASGASTKARLLKKAHNEEARHNQEVQALIHKTKALTQLRSELSGESSLVSPAIFRLVSLEFHEGDFQAALWHHKAVGALTNSVKRLAIREPGAAQGNTLYAVAEVWAAAAALQKPTPCGMVDWSGERRASEYLGGIPPTPDSSIFFLYDLDWPDLHPSVTPTPLRKTFKEIQKFTMYMDRLLTLGEDSVDMYDAVSYLGRRSSAIRAEILNLWLDFEDSHNPRGIGPSEERLDDLVFSASCLAALLFINIMFMYKPNHSTPSGPSSGQFSRISPSTTTFGFTTASQDCQTRSSTPTTCAIPLMSSSINAQPLHRLQDLLHRIHSLQHQSELTSTPAAGTVVDLHLTTWLSFIASLAETLASESHALSPRTAVSAPEPTSAGSTYFTNSLAMLGLRDWRNVKAALRRFLYYEDLMDGYLQKMVGGPMRDGVDYTYSWRMGAEVPTSTLEI